MSKSSIVIEYTDVLGNPYRHETEYEHVARQIVSNIILHAREHKMNLCKIGFRITSDSRTFKQVSLPFEPKATITSFFLHFN